GVAARSECLDVIATQGIRRYRNDRNVLECRVRFNTPCGFIAIDKWKVNVHEDQVKMLCLCQGDPFLARHGFDDLGHALGEEVAHDTPIVFLILDHQNALAHAASFCCSTRTGSVNQNVEPFPRLDSTQTRPPCISTMRLTMASPRPVPPLRRVLELSACRDSSKIVCWSASANPMPRSG